MRIVRFGDWPTGNVVAGERVVDVAASLPALAESTPEAAAVLRPLLANPSAGNWTPLAESGLGGPYLRPGDEVEITIADMLTLRNKVVGA